MKPDKIYIQDGAILRTEKTYDNDVCYIRKDYLLGLAENHYEKFQNTMQEWNGSMFQSSKMLECFADFIDKLNEI